MPPYSTARRKNDRSTPSAGRNTKPAISDPLAAPAVLANVRTPAVSDSERQMMPQGGAEQREEDSGQKGNGEQQRRADLQDRGRVHDERGLGLDDERERGIRDDAHGARGKGDRRAEPVGVRRGAQPERGSQSAERDAGEDDAQHQRQGVRMALDEEEQEAKPHDLERQKAEPGEEGCRQPSDAPAVRAA